MGVQLHDGDEADIDVLAYEQEPRPTQSALAPNSRSPAQVLRWKGAQNADSPSSRCGLGSSSPSLSWTCDQRRGDFSVSTRRPKGTRSATTPSLGAAGGKAKCSGGPARRATDLEGDEGHVGCAQTWRVGQRDGIFRERQLGGTGGGQSERARVGGNAPGSLTMVLPTSRTLIRPSKSLPP